MSQLERVTGRLSDSLKNLLKLLFPTKNVFLDRISKWLIVVITDTFCKITHTYFLINFM